MNARRLDVLSNGQLVGQLRENNDLWAFAYSPGWAASPQGFDLSPALPRFQAETGGPAQPPQAATHQDGASDRPVQWYFDNLLPEEALRTLIAREAALPAEDAFGLLAHFGAESAGSLVLQDPDKPIRAEHGLRPLPLDELSRRIRELPKASLAYEAPKRMSLAGAQHKMLAVGSDGEWFEPLPGTPSTHILKPEHPGGDYPASVMNEYFVMRLAKAVGLEAPAVQRLYVPQPVYVIERFDRYVPQAADHPEASRLHVIDTCQLLNKSRVFKYSAATLPSLREAIAHCRFKAAARLQLYRWLVFNLLIGNGDNHLKNVSFLVDASGIKVAPAYDLLSTAVYDTRTLADEKGIWPLTPLAFDLGEAKTFAGLTRQHVLASGVALGLAPATARRELDRLLKLLPTAADSLLREIEAGIEQDLARSPSPEVARHHVGGELRLLRAIRHLVVAEMVGRLA